MKKRVYLIIYAVVQLVLCVYYGFSVNSVAEEQVKMLESIFKAYPAETRELLMELYTVDLMRAALILTFVAIAIISLILLWIFVKDKVGEKKGLALGLTIASMVLFSELIPIVLGGIAIYLIVKTKKEVKVDEQNKVIKEKLEIQKLRPLKVDSKDILLTIVLVVLYASQFFLPEIITSLTMAIIVQVIYYVGVFGFCIYVFGKRLKRDFCAYKNNFKGYIGYAFKWWGIMYLCALVAGMIRIILGGDAVTANQSGLNDSPIWYIAPLTVIWAPFVEELVFRGCIRRFIKNDKLFIIVSAMVFGLAHTISSEVGFDIIIQSLQYAAMGGIMAYVYTKTNNIGANMTVHCIQNTLATIMMMFM